MSPRGGWWPVGVGRGSYDGWDLIEVVGGLQGVGGVMYERVGAHRGGSRLVEAFGRL